MSKNEEDHIADLKETFANLREAGLKLNPKKCVFGVSRGKMLGYIIGPKCIWANLEKVKAIISMVEPSTKKEVQKLSRRIAALNRFISKSIERSLPFFKALRGGDKVEWGPEQLEAFQQLKIKLHGQQTLSNSTGSKGATIVICGSLRPCSQWGTCSRKGRRVKGHSTACLLHLISLIRSKAQLYGNKKKPHTLSSSN